MKASQARRKSAVVRKKKEKEAAEQAKAKEVEDSKWAASYARSAGMEIRKKIEQAVREGDSGICYEIPETQYRCIGGLERRLKKEGYQVTYKYYPYSPGVGSDSWPTEAHYVLSIEW